MLPDRAVTVVRAEWHGTQALTLTYRDDGGRVEHELLYRANEAALAVEEEGRAWSFDADGQLFRCFERVQTTLLALVEAEIAGA